jgi:hypothetical protein
MFRIIKIQKLDPIIVIVHTLKDALLIVRSTKLTPSFVEKNCTIFICLIYKVLHFFDILNCDRCDLIRNTG